MTADLRDDRWLTLYVSVTDPQALIAKCAPK
jgi:hypothetical protein